MADVFLSYAREDRDRLEPFVKLLESIGASVFWDRNVPTGDTWRKVLDRELANAKCVAVAWSEHSIASHWVLEEAEEGRSRGLLIPFRLDPVEPPIGFRSLQAGDLSAWRKDPDDPDARKVAEAIFARAHGTVAPRREGAQRPTKNTKVPVVSALGALAIAGAAWAARERDSSSSPKKSMTPPTAEVSADPGTEAAVPAPAPEVAPRRIYYENFSESPDATVWLLGDRDDWKGTVQEGRYRLCNRTKSGNASFTSKLRYSEPGVPAVELTDVRVSMRVRLHGPLSRYASAGMLLRADDEGYFAFALSAGGALMFLRTDGLTVKILATLTLNGFKDGEEAELRAEASGETIRLFVNDRRAYEHKDQPVHRGRPGVFAMGVGCFEYDDFSVYAASEYVYRTEM